MTAVVVHLKTQRGQPYGSERRCCERCGVMLWGQPNEPEWTDDPEVFATLPPAFVRCDAARPATGERGRES